MRRASSLLGCLGPAGLACLGLTGCFYLEPINQRPSIDIRQPSSELVYRGSSVTLVAEDNDPEGQVVFFQWRAYACVDANSFETCDRDLIADSAVDTFSFLVPDTLADQVTPVQSILVILEAQDEYGAIARPDERLIIPVANHAPALRMALSQRYDAVVETPIDLFLTVADADDGPAAVTLEWQVFTPMHQPTYTLEDLEVPDPMDMVELQVGKRITPDATGEGTWNVLATATDPLGAKAQTMFTFDVGPDNAPCLAQWAPIAAPSGSTYLLTEPTLFAVNVVSDDLDPYPAVPGDSITGTTTFAWSLKNGAAARTDLEVSANAVALDPESYAPGDIIELRVEIADRKETPINCADASATCSVISDNACIQRQTWRLEVR